MALLLCMLRDSAPLLAGPPRRAPAASSDRAPSPPPPRSYTTTFRAEGPPSEGSGQSSGTLLSGPAATISYCCGLPPVVVQVVGQPTAQPSSSSGARPSSSEACRRVPSRHSAPVVDSPTHQLQLGPGSPAQKRRRCSPPLQRRRTKQWQAQRQGARRKELPPASGTDAQAGAPPQPSSPASSKGRAPHAENRKADATGLGERRFAAAELTLAMLEAEVRRRRGTGRLRQRTHMYAHPLTAPPAQRLVVPAPTAAFPPLACRAASTCQRWRRRATWASAPLRP